MACSAFLIWIVERAFLLDLLSCCLNSDIIVDIAEMPCSTPLALPKICKELSNEIVILFLRAMDMGRGICKVKAELITMAMSFIYLVRSIRTLP